MLCVRSRELHFDYILLSELQPLHRNADATAAAAAVFADVVADDDDGDDDDVGICVDVDKVVVDDDDGGKTMVNEGMFWLMLDGFGALIMIDGRISVWSLEDDGPNSV